MEINAFPDKVIDLGYKGEEERIIVFDLSYFDDFNLLKTGIFDKVIKMKYEVPNDNLGLFNNYIEDIDQKISNILN